MKTAQTGHGSDTEHQANSRAYIQPLDEKAIAGKTVAGIIGDSPSHYSKSPALWNAAFRHLGMNATYLPFDVDDAHVGDLLRVLRDSEQFIGVNVTVPHKVRVMDFLDELDPGAARIQAVNTVVRSADGRLTGYNTDGEGFIDSLFLPTPEHPQGFMPSLAASMSCSWAPAARRAPWRFTSAIRSAMEN